ncbi:hypothetical protein [Streptomyces sp. LN785]|uniref:hypothetical protein n=1 Tax=Streptomyces sp. LN785 TaxID=3112983 RepID=UPI003721D665
MVRARGAADESGEFTGLLERWGGTARKPVPLPAGASVAVLNAVTAVRTRRVGFVSPEAPRPAPLLLTGRL